MFKANLLSAIFASLTILFTYLILKKLQVKEVIAVSVPLILAVSASFWEYSNSADVFTFATFLLSLSLWLLFSRRIWFSFFVLGLSSSHFYITSLLAPLFVWYYWGFKPTIRNFVISVVIFCLGFFPQLVMYYRMLQLPEINWGHVESFTGFIEFVRRKEFGGFFIIQTPVSTFMLSKFIGHIVYFYIALFLEFAILPLALIYPLTHKPFSKSFSLLAFSFLVIFLIQMLTIATIEPNSETFQINKFYILSFFLITLLIGVSLSQFSKVLQKSEKILIPLILLIPLFFLLNFGKRDQSGNLFTQNLVSDALEQLPPGSLAITDNHWFNYGTLYEQKINHKFTDISLLYYPNTVNYDASKYYPKYFQNPPDQKFISKTAERFTLGPGEKIFLDGISRNLDKDIYFIQGTHEEIAFTFIKNYFTPYGLWWKFNVSPKPEDNLTLFENLRNKGVKKTDFHDNQLQMGTLIYAVAYHTEAIYLARNGQYDKALEFFQRSLAVDDTNSGIPNEIKVVTEIKSLETVYDNLLEGKKIQSLSRLAYLYQTIGNYQKSVEVYQKLLEFEPSNKDLKSALDVASKSLAY